METVAPKPSALTPEQIARAWDYVEFVRQEQGSEQDRAKLARFHAGGSC